MMAVCPEFLFLDMLESPLNVLLLFVVILNYSEL